MFASNMMSFNPKIVKLKKPTIAPKIYSANSASIHKNIHSPLGPTKMVLTKINKDNIPICGTAESVHPMHVVVCNQATLTPSISIGPLLLSPEVKSPIQMDLIIPDTSK